MRSLSFKLILFPLFMLSVQSITLQAQNNGMRILSYNILEGMKLDSTKGKSDFVNWIIKADPDILALQEAQELTQRSLEGMARKFGHPYAVLLKEEGYPVALTSKLPIVNVSKVTDNMHHGFIMAEIDVYHIIVNHFSPHKYWKRREEADMVISIIKSKPDSSKWIIMGDFNALSPVDSIAYSDGKLLRRMERKAMKHEVQENLVNGRLDYSVISKFLNAGFLDALKLKNKDFDSTLPTKRFKEKNGARAVKRRVDYIFISKNLKNKVLHAEIVKDDFTDYHSDHYPVLLDLKR